MNLPSKKHTIDRFKLGRLQHFAFRTTKDRMCESGVRLLARDEHLGFSSSRVAIVQAVLAGDNRTQMEITRVK